MGRIFMYRISRKVNFEDGDIIQDIVKCNLPEEVITQTNKMLGIYAPMSQRHKDRILGMFLGDKIRFKIGNMSVSIKYSKS